jgi:hypothetical protein
MGLIRLAIQLASEMGNKQSQQSYEPGYGAQTNQYYVAPQQQRQPYKSCHQMKREYKAERRLARAEARAERVAMRGSYMGGGGCCGKRRRCAPSMQASYGPRGGYVDAPRREYVEGPSRGSAEQERSYNDYNERQHQTQQSGFEDLSEKKAQQPPAYEDVV